MNKYSLKKMEKNIEKNKTYLYVKKFEEISLNSYSFFILTLLTPFISQNSGDTLDFLINVSLILVIVVVLVKKEEVVTNPIFLFFNNKVFRATIMIDGIRKEVFIITKEEQLGSDTSFLYQEYYKNVYYLRKPMPQ